MLPRQRRPRRGDLAFRVEALLAPARRNHDGRGPFAPEQRDPGVDPTHIDQAARANVNVLQGRAVVALRLFAVDTGLDVAEMRWGDGDLGDPFHVEHVQRVRGALDEVVQGALAGGGLAWIGCDAPGQDAARRTSAGHGGQQGTGGEPTHEVAAASAGDAKKITSHGTSILSLEPYACQTSACQTSPQRLGDQRHELPHGRVERDDPQRPPALPRQRPWRTRVGGRAGRGVRRRHRQHTQAVLGVVLGPIRYAQVARGGGVRHFRPVEALLPDRDDLGRGGRHSLGRPGGKGGPHGPPRRNCWPTRRLPAAGDWRSGCTGRPTRPEP